MLSLLILLLGAQGIVNISVREYPKVDETVITITTAYRGAAADLMQGFVTAPIARVVTTVENVDYITSSSRQGSSTSAQRAKLDAMVAELLGNFGAHSRNLVRGVLKSAGPLPK